MKKKNEVKSIEHKFQPGTLPRHQQCSLIVSVTRVIFVPHNSRVANHEKSRDCLFFIPL